MPGNLVILQVQIRSKDIKMGKRSDLPTDPSEVGQIRIWVQNLHDPPQTSMGADFIHTKIMYLNHSELTLFG